MANAKIVTGQYVTLNQMPASLGDRVVARLIDFALLIAYSVLVFFIIMDSDWIHQLPENTSIVITIALYLPALLYHPLMELFHHGQSLGKTLIGIKVVKEDGTCPTLAAYLLRFILDIIDMGISGIGLVSIVLTQKNQRLGDLAAGTMVIKCRTPYIALPDYGYTMDNYTPTYAEAAELNLNQAELITRVLNYSKPDRNELVNRLALKIQRTLGIVPEGGTQEQFLYTIANDYSYYCSTIEA